MLIIALRCKSNFLLTRHILVTVAPENWLKWPMALVFSSLGFPPLTYHTGLFSTKLVISIFS